MTFFTNNAGSSVNSGSDKVLKHIAAANADIVLVQSILPSQIGTMIYSLYAKFNLTYFRSVSSNGVGLLTKYKIIKSESSGFFLYNLVEISNGFRINVFSVDMPFNGYAPNAACNAMTTSIDAMMAGDSNPYNDEKNSRLQLTERLTNSLLFLQSTKKSATAPTIIGGNFNTPSHLDWIEKTKKQNCDWVIQWPITKRFENLGFHDSYRDCHPDPAMNFGYTWSLTDRDNEWNYMLPQKMDRIDYILYSGNLTPVNSEVYKGDAEILVQPNNVDNDWPSNHAAVISDFVVPE